MKVITCDTDYMRYHLNDNENGATIIPFAYSICMSHSSTVT